MTPDVQFVKWPSIPRLYRNVIITEKIDGTNAAVGVTDDLQVHAQSRTRIITPEQDNHGFTLENDGMSKQEAQRLALAA